MNIGTGIRTDVGNRLIEAGFLREIAGATLFGRLVDAIAEADEKSMGLLLSGATGVGKTCAALAAWPTAPIVHAINGLNVDCEFLNGHDVVILDDVGAEARVNDYGVVREPFAELVQRWYVSSKGRARLVITTNLKGSEMRERYGDRTLSRLLATCVSLRMEGGDKRTAERCIKGDSERVRTLIRDFESLVRVHGKENVYPETYIRKKAFVLETQDERDALAAGVRRAMGGHRGCTADPAKAPPLEAIFERMARKMGAELKWQ